jgi:hypothetical protein
LTTRPEPILRQSESSAIRLFSDFSTRSA